MKASDIIEKLSNSFEWIHAITKQTDYSKFWPYATTDFKLFTEVTVRIPTGKQGRFCERLQRRRMDAVAVIRVNDRRYRPILVGIEVKVSASDLMADKKIKEYLPYVDIFYLAIPPSLVEAASDYIKKDVNLVGRVGILKVDRCVRIERQGAVCPPSEKNRGELCQELLMKAVFRQKWAEGAQAV
jgi:hypothetical protein